MKKFKILWRVRINEVRLCRINLGRDRKRGAILCGTKRLRESVKFSATFRKPHTLLIGWYQPLQEILYRAMKILLRLLDIQERLTLLCKI